MKNKIRIAFIGCGNMARAIISSMCDPASVYALKRNGKVFCITAADRDEAQLMPVKKLCAVSLDVASAVADSDHVVLAVKPQDAAAAMRGVSLAGKTVISVMAGVGIAALKELTGSDKIVRAMPNICAAVGESCTAYAATDGIDEQTVTEILGSFGIYRKVDERALDVLTGVTGSGPAYVFEVLKAFRDELISQGIDSAAAMEMAVQTVVGSALYAEKAGKDFDALISDASSAGGATERGMACLRENMFADILRRAMQCSIARAKELAL